MLCTCGSAEKPAEVVEEKPATSVATSSPAYESLSFDRLKHIYENATYMDATFYDLPISINQNETAQIQTTLAGIGSQPMAYRPDCKPIGHIWFQINGKNVEEADIYFEKGCVGYVWYDAGKPAFSNAMTEDGARFYLNIMSQVPEDLR
ncbi:hypothetical protein A3850_014320 [Lewinella sp. 4G2]|nr:hypothetical protein A3850_014320 [Lewinella sp. 4G2]